MALLHSRCEVTALVDCVRVLFKVVPVLWVDVKEREEAGVQQECGRTLTHEARPVSSFLFV